MTWLAWRVHGGKVRLAAFLAALTAAALVASRVVLSSGASQDVKIGTTTAVLSILTLLIVAPALLGMFLGAPLVATEVESRTHRLAWTQSVSRRRWLLVHLGLVLGGSVAAMAVAGGALYWWLQSIVDLQPGVAEAPFQPGIFDAVAIVPAAYTAFAVALGAALGAFTRRTLPAMFLVLLLFTAVRVGIGAGIRPGYEPPLRSLTPVVATQSKGQLPGAPPGAYVVDRTVVDAAGRDVHLSVDAAACRTAADCAGYRLATDYQPEDRFWAFQAVEAGIYVALSVLLLGLTYLRVVRGVT
jgi:hypothetical protein